MQPLSAAFPATRDALRRLACYVIAPVRKAQTGRIGLRPTGTGFGTPVLPDGTRVVVRGDELVVEPGASARLTTLRDAAEFVGVELSPDPGVGRDLPSFTPDDPLDVDEASSVALGYWYAFGQDQLDRLAGPGVSEAQLWPEHFDLAVIVERSGERSNVGFSPGDHDVPDPYTYVGPHDRTGLRGNYWNAPFGAILRYGELLAAPDPGARVAAFIDQGLGLVAARGERS